MIDYLAVMIVAVGAAALLLAAYLYFAPDEAQRQAWGSSFLAIGLLLVLLAVPLNVMWPLTGSYNIAFGEPAILFGLILAAAGIALLVKQEILVPAILGFLGGIQSAIVGFSIMSLHMTKDPAVAGWSYVLLGIGGILTLPALGWRKQRAIAYVAVAFLVVAALMWLYTGYSAYPSHLADFAKYVPASLMHASH